MQELGTVVTYGVRQTVIRQGEQSHHVLLLLSGHLKVVVDTEFGSPVLMALRGRGELLGEMSVLEGLPRFANVVTCTAVRAQLIKNAQLREFLDRNPDAWAALAGALSARLRWANDRRAEFVACPAPVRVGRVLAEIAAEHAATPRQVALAFLTRRRSLFTIPKASRRDHALENAGAAMIVLNEGDVARIDRAFPLGKRRRGVPIL